MILGVTGKPISHSLSPLLHRAAMHALGMNGASLRLIADSAEEALTLSKQLGLRGLNVTAPFKQEIFTKLAGCLGADAVRTGAVNSIIFESTAN